MPTSASRNTRPTPRPRRCASRSTTSSTSTCRRWPSCGGAAAWSARGSSISPPRRWSRIPSWPHSAAACPTRARAAGPSRPPSTKACPRRGSAPRCTTASPRRDKRNSPTRSCPRCAPSSAGTRKRKPRPMTDDTKTSPAQHSDALVLFGFTGDLANKKIFPALYEMAKRGELVPRVVGVSGRSLSDDEVHQKVRDSIEKQGGGITDGPAFDKLQQAIRYVGGDYNKPGTFDALKKALEGS